ncbi:right-handed parallel beta-helix repeat-containing protein [bacterium]|nr:right-handed parallel beta-helix repeat-containing protein [bacterium]
MRASHPLFLVASVCLLLALAACSSGDGDGGGGPGPTVELATISDLRVIAGSDTTVTLAWTVPAALAKAGGDIRYDLRQVAAADRATAWDAWTPLPAPTADAASGGTHTHVVGGLQAGQAYAFRLSASTDGRTWSAPAPAALGVAAADHDPFAPAAITDLAVWSATETSLTLGWSATGDDLETGTAASYEVRWSTTPLDAENFAAATLVAGEPAPVAEAPGVLGITLTGLAAGTTYYCAVVARDDEEQASDLSNVCVAEARDLRVIRVFVDRSGDYPTIEAAIRHATAGDLVLVGPGRYTWTNQATGDSLKGLINVARDQDGFEIRSMAGAEATIIDAERQGGCWSVTGGSFSENGEIVDYAGVTIDGFTLTNGNATGVPVNTEGGGWGGGGIYLHLSDSIIRNCIITGNEAIEGGGVWIGGQGDAILENCLITDNEAEYGGGVLLVNSAPHITVRNCEIRGNTGRVAGGLYAFHCTFTLEDCLIVDNDGGSSGGGVTMSRLWPYDPAPDGPQPSAIIGCTIARNRSINRGSGLYVYDGSIPRVERTVIAFNVGAPAFTGVGAAWIELGCSLVFGHAGGENLPFQSVDLGGNLDVDPQFVDTVDWRPGAASPCLPENRETDACGLIGAREAE